MDSRLLPRPPLIPNENAGREIDLPPPKKPRSCDETSPNSRMPHSALNASLDPPNTSRAVSASYFKTRMCGKFLSGLCMYGDNCSFAHGAKELRPAPLSWQEEQQKIVKHNICRLFYSGRSCTYGDSCHFVHVEPGTLLEAEQRRPRESSAITVRTVPVARPRGQSETIKIASSDDGNNSDRPIPKNVYWKTRLCYKWEIMGRCPYGAKCQYAHGSAELRKPGHLNSDCMDVGASASRSLPSSSDDTLPNNSGSNCNALEGQKKGYLMLEGLKKMSRIYADWIDDIPELYPNVPSDVET